MPQTTEAERPAEIGAAEFQQQVAQVEQLVRIVPAETLTQLLAGARADELESGELKRDLWVGANQIVPIQIEWSKQTVEEAGLSNLQGLQRDLKAAMRRMETTQSSFISPRARSAKERTDLRSQRIATERKYQKAVTRLFTALGPSLTITWGEGYGQDRGLPTVDVPQRQQPEAAAAATALVSAPSEEGETRGPRKRTKIPGGRILVATFLLGNLVVGCEPQETQEALATALPGRPTPAVAEVPPTPVPPQPEASPTPEPTPTPTEAPAPQPTPTVVVETVGFGQATQEEVDLAKNLENSYRQAAEREGKKGTIFLTHGDQEKEIGAYFVDEDNNFWLLIDGQWQAVGDCQGTRPVWESNENRFEYRIGDRLFVFDPQTRQVVDITPVPEPTPVPPPPPTPVPAPTEAPKPEVPPVVAGELITNPEDPRLSAENGYFQGYPWGYDPYWSHTIENLPKDNLGDIRMRELTFPRRNIRVPLQMAIFESVEGVELNAPWGSKGERFNIAILRVKIKDVSGVERSIKIRYPIDGDLCGLFNNAPPEGGGMIKLDQWVANKVNPFKTFEGGTTIEFGGISAVPADANELDVLGITTSGGKF